MKYKSLVAVFFVSLLLCAFVFVVFSRNVLADNLPSDPASHTYKIGGDAGWPELKISLRRIDFWKTLPDGEKSSNGLVVVILGDITALQNEESCLYKHNYKLKIGNKIIKSPSTIIGTAIRDAYNGLGDPTTAFTGACAKPGKPATIFMWFDVEDIDGPISLNLNNNTQILIANSFQELLVDSGGKVFTATSTPLPTRTPLPTSTPTITPTPTNTPLPTVTPLPTATLSPLDELKKSFATVAANCGGEQCNFSSLEFDTDGDSKGDMVIRFIDDAPSSIWSVDDFNRDTGLKIFYTLKAVSEINLDYDAVAFEFKVPVVDKYGNGSVEMGISCYFSKDTVKLINYPNIRMRYIVDLADRAYINPVLRQER